MSSLVLPGPSSRPSSSSSSRAGLQLHLPPGTPIFIKWRRFYSLWTRIERSPVSSSSSCFSSVALHKNPYMCFHLWASIIIMNRCFLLPLSKCSFLLRWYFWVLYRWLGCVLSALWNRLVASSQFIFLDLYCAARSRFPPKFLCDKCHEFDLLGAISAKLTWKLQQKIGEHWKIHPRFEILGGEMIGFFFSAYILKNSLHLQLGPIN